MWRCNFVSRSSLSLLLIYIFHLAPLQGETFVSRHAPLSPRSLFTAFFLSKTIAGNGGATDSSMNMHINLLMRRGSYNRTTAMERKEEKKSFHPITLSKSAIITNLYIICIFQLLFKSCIGFCMQMYNIFRIRYVTIKSASIQALPCAP